MVKKELVKQGCQLYITVMNISFTKNDLLINVVNTIYRIAPGCIAIYVLSYKFL
jgi:hypothetical protein